MIDEVQLDEAEAAWSHVQTPVWTNEDTRDCIRSLIAEVRRLRLALKHIKDVTASAHLPSATMAHDYAVKALESDAAKGGDTE